MNSGPDQPSSQDRIMEEGVSGESDATYEGDICLQDIPSRENMGSNKKEDLRVPHLSGYLGQVHRTSYNV